MDEIRKIPPVTRYMVGATLAITLPILLELVSIYPIVSSDKAHSTRDVRQEGG